MTALIIIAAIILFLLILLFLPLTVDLSYSDKLLLKVKYSGITLFNNSKAKKTKKVKKTQRKRNDGENKKPTKKKDNFVVSTYKQKGLLGTIKYFSNILSLVLKKLWWLIKRLKFKKFKLDLAIATNDAADTAIEYGKTCAALYPVLSLLQTNINFKPQEINVRADFEKNKTELKASILLTTSLLNYLILAISALMQFIKLQNKESEKYERKQSEERYGHYIRQTSRNGRCRHNHRYAYRCR